VFCFFSLPRLHEFLIDVLTSSSFHSQGCVSDSGARSLTGYSEERLSSWTVKTCTDLCMSKGFAMAGIEVATECYVRPC
jgi:hypothetical protein